jgi:hypothetical protein
LQISVQCMVIAVDNLWSRTSLYNKSYLMNFRRWNYNNCAFYYYYHYLINILHNLPGLLPNATPLVSRIFAEMSKKRQRCAVLTYKTAFRCRQSLQTFTVIVGNNYPRISGKMGFTIADMVHSFLFYTRVGYFIFFLMLVSELCQNNKIKIVRAASVKFDIYFFLPCFVFQNSEYEK